VARGALDRLRDRLRPARTAALRWPAGAARIDAIAVDDVQAACDRLLPARRAALAHAG
jgi:hypothetical protein